MKVLLDTNVALDILLDAIVTCDITGFRRAAPPVHSPAKLLAALHSAEHRPTAG